MTELKYKRNFCITAHIDHGKSTLADRLIQKARIIDDRQMKDQILDSMDIERERGITIKSQAVTIPYHAKDGHDYELNFVDTPGHVDFSYEVSRAIASCEGALLLIDATQGVESQTVSNMYLALEQDLTIVPVINKIDLASADVESTKKQIDHDLGLDASDAVLVSAKTGQGVDELLEAIVQKFPPPDGDAEAPLQALIFDCHYDEYRGVVVHIRVMQGRVKEGDVIRLMGRNADYKAEQIGVFKIKYEQTGVLEAGDVGYIIAGMKTISEVRVGDTITNAANPAPEPLAGFKEVKPVVFSSIYPIDSNDYEELKESMEKLKLNDASLVWEKDNSLALGNGFRCGFLGLLHMDVIQERLDREFNMNLIATTPSVIYRITKKDGSVLEIDNPLHFPDPSEILKAEEPFVAVNILTPSDRIGVIMQLALDRRGEMKGTETLDPLRCVLHFDMPLNEIITDFYDKIKNMTSGYGSMDYEPIGFREGELVKLDLLLNGEPVDAFSMIVHKDRAYPKGRLLAERLKEVLPRQQFAIAIQAAVGGKVIARETINALRKDVLAKCYGGDITRKRKLLEKQKEGKKKMKQIGKVFIPQKAFIEVLKSED